MALTQTTLGEMLKRLYDSRMVETLQNLSSPLHDYIKRAPDGQVGGSGLFFAVNVGGDDSGYGFHAEDAALPTATNEVVKQATLTPKPFSGTVKITGLAKAISGNDAFSFANGLQYNIDQKLKRMTRYLEGALFRDGTGLLAQFAGAPGATTSAVSVDTPGNQYIRVNMLVDVLDDSTGTRLVSGAKVTAVDRFGGTVTFDTDFSSLVGDNDQLYLAGTQPASGGPVTREILGFGAAIATSGSYLGISRTSYPEWKAVSISASNTDLDEDRMYQLQNRIKIQGGNDTAGFQCVMHPNQMRKFFELVQSRMRFTDAKAVELKPSVIRWSGMDIIETDQCPTTQIYMGDFSKFQRFAPPGGDLHLSSDFGGEVIKWVPGYDAGLCYARSYSEYAIRKPNAFGTVTSLNDVTNA